MRHQCLQLSLHCLHCAAFRRRPLHTVHRVFASYVLCIWIPQLCIPLICISDNRWCASALKDSLFVCAAISLGAQTFAPLSPPATPSAPFARFIFHARSRRPCPPTPACPPLPLYRSLHSCLEPAQSLQRSAEATHTFVLSSTHDCDGHVYNVIRLCQTCHRSAVVHLKAIYHDGPVRCWRPAVALSRSVTLISQVLTRRCTWIKSIFHIQIQGI